MITCSDAFKAHLASHDQTVATLLYTQRRDGTITCFTDHDVDIVYGGQTYKSNRAYARTDMASSSDLSVDNLEFNGALASPFITENDLKAGLWDFAKIIIYLVNYLDVTMNMILRTGTIGQVTVNRNGFNAEFRGIAQAYTRVIGQLTSPSCTTTLGSALCKINLTPFTFTGALTGVGVDNRTLYDTARTQPGPAGGIAILGISNANPGVVTLAAPLGQPNGSAVMISQVLGMGEVNTVVVVDDVAGNSFELDQDTTNYGHYTSGGIVTPLGSDSGYFDNGIITFTSGLNTGLSMEIAKYVPGQLLLQLPMPYEVEVGDAYTIVAGCDYSANTCNVRFSNIVNMRAFPFVPGMDKLIQIGKQS